MYNLNSSDPNLIPYPPEMQEEIPGFKIYAPELLLVDENSPLESQVEPIPGIVDKRGLMLDRKINQKRNIIEQVLDINLQDIEGTKTVLRRGNRFSLNSIDLQHALSEETESNHSGKFGKILVGYDEVENKEVVFKLPNPGFGGDRIMRLDLSSLKVEWQTLQQLNHPNIIRQLGMTEFVLEDGARIPSLILEKADGNITDLARTFSLNQKLEGATLIATQIGSALDYLNFQKGIIHRDIKLDNILHVGGNTFKLVDFGLAGRADQTGMWLNTRRPQAAPEQYAGIVKLALEGTKPVHSPASDQFALAVTIYQFITGSNDQMPTFTDGQTISGFKATPEQQLIRRREIPASLYQVLQKATSYNPGDRFASCSEFATAFQSASQQSYQMAA